jgi:hypothetical protein
MSRQENYMPFLMFTQTYDKSKVFHGHPERPIKGPKEGCGKPEIQPQDERGGVLIDLPGVFNTQRVCLAKRLFCIVLG